MKILILRISFVILLLSGCRKDKVTPQLSANPDDFDKVFQSFWIQMNNNYVYWGNDHTNWDSVYQHYDPLFAKLDIHNNNDVNTAYGYFESMTEDLIDNHYLLTFSLPGISGKDIYPALNRKLASKTFHSAYNYLAADTGYLGKGYQSGFYITDDHKRLQVIAGLIKGTILYFNCNIFALQEAYTSAYDNTAKRTIQYFLDQMQSTSIKGIIVDVRNNPGGKLEDLNFLAGQFIDKPLNFGFTRYKSGLERLNYTPWIASTIMPQRTGKPIGKPLIVLTDNFTISLGEALAMAIHCLPNSKIIGEHTWGATGPVTDNVIYNDGPFNIPGVMTAYTSSAAFKYIDGEIYEGTGFPPDVSVSVNQVELNAGQDNILNKSVEIILK